MPGGTAVVLHQLVDLPADDLALVRLLARGDAALQQVPIHLRRRAAASGNPLFAEGLVAIEDKDLYSRTSPSVDKALFRKYAENPELAKLLNRLVLEPDIPGIETGRTDIAGIFIPDVIKVDLSTGPARLAGGGPTHPTNPDDPGFSRLSIFGQDVLISKIQPGFGKGVVPGGWPNGRRFGDDVVDIAVTALISDLARARRSSAALRATTSTPTTWRSTRCSRTSRRRRTGGGMDTTKGTVTGRARAAAFAAALVFLFVAPLGAHDPGLSSLDVQLGDVRVVATLSLSRADARAAESADGSIEAFALRSTILEIDGVRLAGRVDTRATESDAGTRLAIAFDRTTGSRLRIRSTTGASLARGHRQLLTVRDADNRVLLERMLDGSAEHVDVDVAAAAHAPTTSMAFVRLGVGHILSGVDHLAFLAALLLGVSRLRAVVTTVTAFTVAHSLTLSAAVLGLIDVPPAVVEPLIAASVVFVGLRTSFAGRSIRAGS